MPSQPIVTITPTPTSVPPALTFTPTAALPTLTPTPTAVPPTPTPIPPTPTPQGRTIVVTNAADSGPGTLRQALLDAKPGDTITFDPAVFLPKAPVTIALASGLPGISQGHLTIDASNAGMILDGSNIQETSTNGLSISSNGNTVRGLQIVRFPAAGIALFGGARNNTIGGDHSVGAGPLGQGNLVSGNKAQGIGVWDASYNIIMGNYVGTNVNGTEAWGNANGVHMNGASYNQVIGNLVSGNDVYGIEFCCTSDTHDNTISGNRVGTDTSGKVPLGNQCSGVAIHDGASHNTVGPDNLIAYNGCSGIQIYGSDSLHNTITQNSIHDNQGLGIDQGVGGNTELAAPVIFDFDLSGGTVAGITCANCMVEIFSDGSDEGVICEGQAKADSNGAFSFIKGSAFTGPHLTAIATDAEGNSSEFSVPTLSSLQEGNRLPRTLFRPQRSQELANNRIGAAFAWETDCQLEYLDSEILALGAKRAKIAISEIEAESTIGETRVTIDWGRSEFSLTPNQDGCIDALVDAGISITYILSFWDKANHPEGWEPIGSRFRTEEEIQRYLDYVRFIVRRLKDHVQYYEIWNEPDNNASPVQYIEVADYINLVKRTVPVIREEYPDARIVVGSIVLQDPRSRDYLFNILKSDVMSLVDVVSWHAMFGVSPEYNSQYYYEYPSLVQEIKDVATAHGFKGEYWGDELVWRSTDCPWCFPGDPLYSNAVAAKYHARGIVMHLGMDVATQVTGNSSLQRMLFSTIRNLCTIMAGVRPISLTVEIQSEATNIMSYGFTLPNGDQLFALWTNGVAVDDDPGVKATLTVRGISAQKVIGIDVLNGFEQPLNTSSEGGNLA